ncbi:hypothetical protein HPB47_014891 [Ixodes persulcatus]|uniref:Uncharacterized protein n=1 Tax=Ixodes persulcatus TaxID=34615 RepID=A0AC60QV50_IXOPE|nr:hypothetical protein HPB47_014891 [Ixodes persulcatus]
MATGADQGCYVALFGLPGDLEEGSDFWAEDPALWFVQVENKFRLHRITSQIRQYELLIDALPPQAATEVRDILLAPLGDTPSDASSSSLALKNWVTVGHLSSCRLPPPVRVGLAVAHGLPLLELAELADRIMEVNSPTIGATQRTSDLTSDIAELRKAMEKLTAEVSELRRESSQRARRCADTTDSLALRPATVGLPVPGTRETGWAVASGGHLATGAPVATTAPSTPQQCRIATPSQMSRTVHRF